MTVKKKASKKVTKKKASSRKGKTKTVTFEVPVTGRPTKYDPKFCETVIEYMAKGYSKQAVAGVIEISVDTLYEWAKKHKDFSDAISIGEAKARLWFDNVLANHLTHNKNGQQINGQVYALNMKNRFGFSDKKEIDLGGDKDKALEIKLNYNYDNDNPQKKEEEDA